MMSLDLIFEIGLENIERSESQRTSVVQFQVQFNQLLVSISSRPKTTFISHKTFNHLSYSRKKSKKSNQKLFCSLPGLSNLRMIFLLKYTLQKVSLEHCLYKASYLNMVHVSSLPIWITLDKNKIVNLFLAFSH